MNLFSLLISSMFKFYTHLLATTLEARVALQAVHQWGFIFYQLFLLNYGQDTKCKSEGGVHEKVLF